MTMKSSAMTFLAAFLAAAVPAFAEDAATAANRGADDARTFTTLPLCQRLHGSGDVKKPGQDWSPIEEGRFYPLGSSFRAAKDGKVEIAFGRECKATISDGGWFATRLQGLGVTNRTIILGSGELKLSLPRNLREGFFSVTAPGFTIRDLAGDSIITFAGTGDGEDAKIRCVTGALCIEGRHFRIPAMHAANEVRVRTSHDLLFTGLYGTRGDYTVELDQGIASERVVDADGNSQVKYAPKTLLWKMSPETCVRIQRAVPSVGERMSVCVMTFDAVGEMKNCRSFSEGRREVNSGEQIASKAAVEAAAEAVRNAEDAAKKAEAESVTEEKGEDAETPAGE